MADLLLATAGEDVRLWTMPELNLHSVKCSSTNSVNHCVCSNNGQLVAYANQGLNISVSFLHGQSAHNTFEIPTACEQSSVAFSNNSRFIVSGGHDCIVNVWDVKSRTVRRTFQDHINPVTCCTFNFNDKIIASSSDQGEIILTEVSSGSALGPLLGSGTDRINCLSYSYFTHSLLANSDNSGAVTLWDINERKLLKTFTDHSLSSTSLAFSPLNDMLLSSTGLDKRIIFYDVCYKKIVKTINTEEPLTSCDFLHDGTTVAVGSSSGHLYIFDLRHGSSPLKVIKAHDTSVKSASFQKLPKERTSRPPSQELKVENSVTSSKFRDTSGKDIPLEKESTETKRSQSQNIKEHQLDLVPSREKIPDQQDNTSSSQEDNNSISSIKSKSTNNLHAIPTKSAKIDGEFFSPIVETSGRKPVTRSKSALKKYDLKKRNSSSECLSQPSLGLRSKSGLSRLSLLSHSTGDLSKSGKKPEKPFDAFAMRKTSTEDLVNAIKTNRDTEMEPLDVKKGILKFKSPFRKRNTDSTSKVTDDSETSSNDSFSLVDKMYTRGKKDRVVNYSNDSDTRSIGSRITDVTQSMSPSSFDQSTKNIESMSVGASTKTKNLEHINVTEIASKLESQGNLGGELPVEFIQNMIDEAMEENRTAIHKDLCNLQFEFIRQMEIQKEQIRQMLEHYSINEDLMNDIQRLRAENEVLKGKY